MCKKWTLEELDILKNNYESKPKKQLLILLQNRTWVAIQLKASNLKLSVWGTPKKRFWKYVNKRRSHECWNWTGCCRYGYGRISINRVSVLAHRFSWELHCGKIADKLFVCHHCDNPKCVNPNHLFLGTNRDNVNDMVNKDRQWKKLTFNQIKEIRLLYREGKFSQRKIAKNFNIHQSTVSNICSGKTWGNI